MPRTEADLLEVVYRRSADITRRRRMTVATIAAISVVVAIAVPYGLMRDVDSTSRVVPPAGERSDPSRTAEPAASSAPVVRAPASIADPVSSDVDEVPVSTPSAPSSRSTDRGASCSRVIEDEKGDAKDPQLDILSSTITYNADRDELVFTHRIRDLGTVYSSGEGRKWDLLFSFGQRRYTVRAEHLPGDAMSNGTEEFAVFRGSTAGSIAGDDTVTIAKLFGTIDTDEDVITVLLPLASFNEGEAEQSRDEAHAPPPPMKVGSRLDDVAMRTATTKLAASDAGDEAAASCDYLVS